MDISELYQIYQAHPVITTDSRDCPEGSIFLALKGASFDGNKFADMALEKGCAYVIVDEKEYAKEGDERYILVEDCLTTFKELAREHRRHFDIPVVGITGTNGKTTTKELVSAVLSKKHRIVATQGNFNNHIGVPLTLLRIDEKTEVAVVEMGASAPGEIASLTKVVQPTCGLITSVGKAHLQGFGSFEGVKKTKGELYDYLRQKGGLVFYNADSEHLGEMVQHRTGLRLCKYGVRYQEVTVLQATAENPFLTLEIPRDGKSVRLSTRLVGAYNADNVMASLCAGEYFGVPFADCCRAIESYVPSNSRSQMVRTKRNSLIIDAYNANPSSLRAGTLWATSSGKLRRAQAAPVSILSTTSAN